MHNEKQNNAVSWKDKLEDFSNFQDEEMIDKNAAWQKLHNRLREKPRNNKLIWYWLAAACFLLIFFVPKISSKKNETDLVKHILKQNKKTTQADIHISAATENINKTKVASVQIEMKPVTDFIKKEKSSHILKNELVKDIPIALDYSKNNNRVIINTPMIADTPLIVIASLPAKKKLHVLHINEIENPNEGMTSSNTNDQQHNFNLPFAKTNDLNKQQTSSTRDYAGIIKIKISSQN
jgi:hypothetical protein